MMKVYDNLHGLWARSHAAGSPTKYVRDAVLFKELDQLVPGRALDAGCGTGEYSFFLSCRGHTVSAFDPSPYAIKSIKTRDGEEKGIKLEVNNIEGFNSSFMFDNIISIEVIEHLKSDKDAIKKLYSLVKTGGLLILSVPATPFLYSKGDRVSRHHRRYKYRSFIKLLYDAGFRSIKIKRYGFPMLFIYSILRKMFFDKMLIRHFASNSENSSEIKRFFLGIFPFIFSIDKLNIPFWSVGYVARCRK